MDSVRQGFSSSIIQGTTRYRGTEKNCSLKKKKKDVWGEHCAKVSRGGAVFVLPLSERPEVARVRTPEIRCTSWTRLGLELYARMYEDEQEKSAKKENNRWRNKAGNCDRVETRARRCFFFSSLMTSRIRIVLCTAVSQSYQRLGRDDFRNSS